MPLNKKFIGFVLFSALIFFKAVSFHVYTHQEADSFTPENCSICELAVENQTAEADLSSPEYPDLNSPALITNEQVIVSAQEYSSYTWFRILSRPPPTSISA